MTQAIKDALADAETHCAQCGHRRKRHNGPDSGCVAGLRLGRGGKAGRAGVCHCAAFREPVSAHERNRLNMALDRIGQERRAAFRAVPGLRG